MGVATRTRRRVGEANVPADPGTSAVGVAVMALGQGAGGAAVGAAAADGNGGAAGPADPEAAAADVSAAVAGDVIFFFGKFDSWPGC